jgi:hypothetical protein
MAFVMTPGEQKVRMSICDTNCLIITEDVRYAVHNVVIKERVDSVSDLTSKAIEEAVLVMDESSIRYHFFFLENNVWSIVDTDYAEEL